MSFCLCLFLSVTVPESVCLCLSVTPCVIVCVCVCLSLSLSLSLLVCLTLLSPFSPLSLRHAFLLPPLPPPPHIHMSITLKKIYFSSLRLHQEMNSCKNSLSLSLCFHHPPPLSIHHPSLSLSLFVLSMGLDQTDTISMTLRERRRAFISA